MATITRYARNTVGTKRERYIKMVTGGAETQISNIGTGLRWIDHVGVQIIGGSDRDVDTWPNSATIAGVEDDPGVMSIDGATASSTYLFYVRGK